MSQDQGFKQKNKKLTNSHQNKRKEGNICIVGCELFYRLWPQEEDELLSSYSFAWLLTGDFRLAKGDVKRISFFHVNGRFVRYLNPFFATEIRNCLIHHAIPNVYWFGTQVCKVFIQTKIISNFIVLNLTADWKKALAQFILTVVK